MEVKLIDFTGFGTQDPARHAANVLVFTKNTRLDMRPGLMEDIASWPQAKIDEVLAYMANTIPSSWEFVDYTFLITDVTRGFTHQFVRTRTGSYAQQTMRVLNVGGWTYGTGPTLQVDPEETEPNQESVEKAAQLYHKTMDSISLAYDELVASGIAIEDARGILPTNIHTNIVAKFNLRNVADLVRKRSSTRTQGEYRLVLEAMKAEVMRVHPWAKLFLERDFNTAASDLERRIVLLADDGVIEHSAKIDIIKLIDQMRGNA